MPEWRDEIKQRLAGLQLEPTREADIIEELAQHLDDLYAELRRGGANDDTAYHETLRELSEGRLMAQELSRVEAQVTPEPVIYGASRAYLMSDLWRDLRFGVRMLGKTPGLTVVALLTLALGIGANTAIFSLIDAFLLRTLPVKDPQQLVFVRATLPNGRMTNSFSISTCERFRDQAGSFSGMFAWDNTPINVTVAGRPEMVWGDFVSGSYFDVLGVSAALGRTFTADDDQPGKPPVTVISYPYWERRFGRDPAVIGKTVDIGKIPFTIIGVAPREFFGRSVAGKSADLILPMFLQPRLALRDHDTFQVMARLKPGVRSEEASDELSLLFQQALRQTPGPQIERGSFAPRIELRAATRGEFEMSSDFATELTILSAVVAIILLIACVNVANLLLTRAAARRKEIAVRLALGASRKRLIHQLLTESFLMAGLGAVFGLFFAAWGVGALLAVLSARDDIPFTLRPDLRTLAFTGGVAMVTGLVFGLVPSLTATRMDLHTVLKGVEGGVRSRPSRRRAAKSLVAAQVALSLVLLIGAGLLLDTLRSLYAVDTGFDRDKVLTLWVFPSLAGYDHEKEMRLYHDLLDRMAAVPSVESASLSRRSLTIAKGDNIIGPGFFKTLGISLLAGREFTVADTLGSPKVAIISESAARKFFPDGNALGRLLPEEAGAPGERIEVVGVARDTRSRLRQPGWDEVIYTPYTQAPPERLGQIKLYVRADDPANLVPALRDAIASIDKDLALRDLEPLAAEMNRFVGEERSVATLLTGFGVLALTLAAIGLYGTMSYAVGQRTKELGIRMALGAQKKDILRMVLGEALSLATVGIIIGVPAALACTRLIANLLFGIRATDPAPFVAAILLMTAVALSAGYLPARRATKIDPMEALRYE